MSRVHIDEAHRLRRENEILRKALKECADVLEAVVNALGSDSVFVGPLMQARVLLA